MSVFFDLPPFYVLKALHLIIESYHMTEYDLNNELLKPFMFSLIDAAHFWKKLFSNQIFVKLFLCILFFEKNKHWFYDVVFLESFCHQRESITIICKALRF